MYEHYLNFGAVLPSYLNLYGTIEFIHFKLIENGLIYTLKTGKQRIILEIE